MNTYVSEMSKKDLAGIICDYLELLQDEGGSHFFDCSSIALIFVINIGKDKRIN